MEKENWTDEEIEYYHRTGVAPLENKIKIVKTLICELREDKKAMKELDKWLKTILK